MTQYNIVSAASLVAGQPEDISVVLSNLQAIATVLNGGLDDTNINAAAAIALSKLAGYPSDLTKFARGDGTWAAPPAPVIPTINYGITLPASPTDGQEAILVDSLTNPTYQWRFRYNAGSSSAYKWEFIGGTRVIVPGPGSGSVNTTFSVLSTPVAFTVPRAGDYHAECAAYCSFPNAPDYFCYFGVKAGATNPADGDYHTFNNITAGGGAGSYNGPSGFVGRRVNGLAASDVLTAGGRTNAASANLSAARLAVTPIRVS